MGRRLEGVVDQADVFLHKLPVAEASGGPRICSGFVSAELPAWVRLFLPNPSELLRKANIPASIALEARESVNYQPDSVQSRTLFESVAGHLADSESVDRAGGERSI